MFHLQSGKDTRQDSCFAIDYGPIKAILYYLLMQIFNGFIGGYNGKLQQQQQSTQLKLDFNFELGTIMMNNC
ncbi:hypothetical protein BLOT_013791 [Blomia tropicalis]|nr:hypothetical protein BLOT_013791 [Blomia tropicalis]